MTVEQSPKIVSVITRDDIHRAAAQTINDVLKLATGVDVRQRGGFGVQTDISINGGTFDQIHSPEWCRHFQSSDWSQCF